MFAHRITGCGLPHNILLLENKKPLWITSSYEFMPHHRLYWGARIALLEDELNLWILINTIFYKNPSFLWLVELSLSRRVLIFALFPLYSRWSQSNSHCLRMKAYSKLPWSVEQNAHFVMGLDNFVWTFYLIGNICDSWGL